MDYRMSDIYKILTNRHRNDYLQKYNTVITNAHAKYNIHEPTNVGNIYLVKNNRIRGDAVIIMNRNQLLGDNANIDVDDGESKLVVYDPDNVISYGEIRPGECKKFMFSTGGNWGLVPSVSTIEIPITDMTSSGEPGSPYLSVFVTTANLRRFRYIHFTWSEPAPIGSATINGSLPFGTYRINRIGIRWFPTTIPLYQQEIRFLCDLTLFNDDMLMDAPINTQFSINDTIGTTGSIRHHVSPFVRLWYDNQDIKYNEDFTWYLTGYQLRIRRDIPQTNAYTGDIGILGITLYIENSEPSFV